MAYGSVNNWAPPRTAGGIPLISTRFSLSVENEEVDAGRDGRTRFARPNIYILGRERGMEKTHFSCSADHEQDWQPSHPVDPYSAI